MATGWVTSNGDFFISIHHDSFKLEAAYGVTGLYSSNSQQKVAESISNNI